MLASLPQNGIQTAALTGSITNGDVLTLTVFDIGLSGGSEDVNYTVQTGDTLETVAAALATAINADTNLQTIDVSADSVTSVVNISSDGRMLPHTRNLQAAEQQKVCFWRLVLVARNSFATMLTS
jgi:phage tail sheath gpL-like